jgi:hypothetical protein
LLFWRRICKARREKINPLKEYLYLYLGKEKIKVQGKYLQSGEKKRSCREYMNLGEINCRGKYMCLSRRERSTVLIKMCVPRR